MSDIITNATEENCCEYGGVLALFLGLLCFYPLVCVQYNTRMRKSSEKRRRPGNTYHVNDMRWTRGGREVDVGGEGYAFKRIQIHEITY